MKKYLITGALALVACATLTSCHSDDELSGSLIEQKLQTYEKVFKEEFGEVNPNQDWGFGVANQISARTRADEVIDPTTHVGAYPDANMWTSKGYLAPPPLTTSQKLRAQYYFQMNKIVVPNRPNYGTKDFFIQQVYDGGDDPMTGYTSNNNPETGEPYSKEVYLAANNETYIQSGEHMDHLTAGPGHLHIYNFNNGNCSTNDNVADRDQTDVNNTKQQHSDKIQLMLKTPTSCFGYANSDASFVRDDRWTLVGAKTIDEFCDSDAGFQAWLSKRLPAGEEDKKCDDEYHRSYIGFDFDMLPDEHIISGSYEWDTSVTPHKCTKVNYYNYFCIYIGNDTKVWNGKTLVDVTSVGEVGYKDGNRVLYPYMPNTTEKVKMVNANTNEYCGSSETWNDDYWKYTDSDNTVYKRIDYMKTALIAGKLPTTSSDKTWVTIGNCADGYYSDWIVTFMPATSGITLPIEDGGHSTTFIRRTYRQLCYRTDRGPTGRIMCEDLGTSSISDIDFNDIVFDAWMYNMVPLVRTKIVKVVNNVETEIIKDWSDDWEEDPAYADRAHTVTDVYLLAGGGTIPATVNGVAFKSALGSENPILVNTVDDRDKDNPKKYGNPFDNKIGWHQPAELKDIENLNSFNDIDVVVLYQNSPVKLTSEPGEVPHKICVPIGTKWPYERVVINEAYDFNDYVKNGSTVTWSSEENAKPIYNDNDKIIGYYLDERVREDNVWTKDANDTEPRNETGSRYHGDIPEESEESDITGIPYKNSARELGTLTTPIDLGYNPAEDEEVTESGTSGGYQQGDPVLIRVRH